VIAAVLVVCWAAPVYGGDSSSEVCQTIIRDEFDAPAYHWVPWEQRSGEVFLQEGSCVLRITDEATSQHDHVAAIHDYYDHQGNRFMPWLFKGIEMKLRCTDDNAAAAEDGGGVRFWGLANLIPFHLPPRNALYFWSGSPECGEEAQGFSAVSIVQGETGCRQPLPGIDVTDWHTYTILWRKGNATFLVDGDIVASTGDAPIQPMGTSVFLSNTVVGGEVDAVDMNASKSLEIEYIHLFYIDREGLSAESEEIGRLLDQVEILEGFEGPDAQRLKADLARAEELWDEHRFLWTRDLLEAILLEVPKVEIIELNWFELARQSIVDAENEGRTRDALIMKGKLNQAENRWEEGDYLEAKGFLEQIVFEPMVMTLLCLLALVVQLRLPVSPIPPPKNHRKGRGTSHPGRPRPCPAGLGLSRRRCLYKDAPQELGECPGRVPIPSMAHTEREQEQGKALRGSGTGEEGCTSINRAS
jgi:hypothetical protein